MILRGLRLSANRDEQKMSSPEGGGTKFSPQQSITYDYARLEKLTLGLNDGGKHVAAPTMDYGQGFLRLL